MVCVLLCAILVGQTGDGAPASGSRAVRGDDAVPARFRDPGPEPALTADECLKIAESVAGHPLILRRHPMPTRVGPQESLGPKWLPDSPGRASVRFEADEDGRLLEVEIDALDGSLISYGRDTGPPDATADVRTSQAEAEATARDWMARYWRPGGTVGELRLRNTELRDGNWVSYFIVEAGDPPRRIWGVGCSVHVSAADGRVVAYLRGRELPATELIDPKVTPEQAVASSMTALKLTGYDECHPVLTQAGDVTLYYQVDFGVRPEHLPPGIEQPMGQALAFVDAVTGEVLQGGGIMRSRVKYIVAGRTSRREEELPPSGGAQGTTDAPETPPSPKLAALPWLPGAAAVPWLGATVGVMALKRRGRPRG